MADKERYDKYLYKKNLVEAERKRLEEKILMPKEVNDFLEKHNSTPLQNKISMAELLKRPEITYESLAEIDHDRPELSSHAINQLEVQLKYAGYINKQLMQIERFRKLENKPCLLYTSLLFRHLLP